MGTFDVYGVSSDSLDGARDLVEAAVGRKFVAHESDYRGGAYYRADGCENEEEMILQRNHDPFEDEWAEPEWKDFQNILYVSLTLPPQEIEKSLAGVGRLLRRREF